MLELLVLNPRRKNVRKRRKNRITKRSRLAALLRRGVGMKRAWAIVKGGKARRRRNRTGVPFSGPWYRPRLARRSGAIARTARSFHLTPKLGRRSRRK